MTVRNITACALLLCTGPALADTLPLRHGAYVSVDTDCKDPPNVALRTSMPCSRMACTVAGRPTATTSRPARLSSHASRPPTAPGPTTA